MSGSFVLADNFSLLYDPFVNRRLSVGVPLDLYCCLLKSLAWKEYHTFT